MQVLNNPYNKKRSTEDFLIDASKYIKNQTGIKLDITIKEFEDGLNIDIENIENIEKNKI